MKNTSLPQNRSVSRPIASWKSQLFEQTFYHLMLEWVLLKWLQLLACPNWNAGSDNEASSKIIVCLVTPKEAGFDCQWQVLSNISRRAAKWLTCWPLSRSTGERQQVGLHYLQIRNNSDVRPLICLTAVAAQLAPKTVVSKVKHWVPWTLEQSDWMTGGKVAPPSGRHL